MIDITIGATIAPRIIPNLNHILFKGLKSFEFKIPKIKKRIENQNGITFTCCKSPLKDQKAIIKNTAKKTKPKLRFEPIFILDFCFIVVFVYITHYKQLLDHLYSPA